MNVLIGDIGNTVTKICIIDSKSFKIKKIVYFDSKKIINKNLLKKQLDKIIKIKPLKKLAFFSSVVPKYEVIIRKYMKKYHKIKLKEIKEKLSTI